MRKMKKPAIAVAIMLFALTSAGAAPAGDPVASDAQLKIAVAVAPDTVGAGLEALVTVKLDPKPGIKLNKYPKIKLQIPAVSGLVGASEQSLGNTAPPPADQLEANYFREGVDPLSLTLHIDPQAAKGRHEIRGKLSYFYCVAASGYCAPAKTELTIPIIVR
jgi:hypothetical protein